MNILVTGSSGFLGAHLVPLLASRGHRVKALMRGDGPKFGAGVEIVRGDLRDRESIRKAIIGVDAIYHLAGLVSFRPEDGRKMYEIHVDCTRELLRDVRDSKSKPRFILASTSGAIAVSKTDRIGSESDDYPIETVGRWPYYLSKIYEEKLTFELCKQAALPLVVLNPSLLLGPGDDRLSSTWTVAKFLSRDIPAMPRGGMSFVDVRDAAEVFANALERGELGGRHLFGVNMSMDEFFKRLSRMTGVPAPRLKLPPKANFWGAQILESLAKSRGAIPALDPQEVEIGDHYFYLNAAKATQMLGFAPRDVHETLFDTVQYILGRMPPNTLPGTKGKLAELRER